MPARPTRVENVARGTLLSALVTIPVGAALWILLWEGGVVAGIVGFGVSVAAVGLYRLGAGELSRTGAIRATVITAVTMVAGIIGGLAVDLLPAYTSYTGLPWAGAIVSPEFWRFFGSVVTDPGFLGRSGLSILFALFLAALGCFSTLRRALHSTRAPAYTTYFGPSVPPPGGSDVPPVPHAPRAPEEPDAPGESNAADGPNAAEVPGPASDVAASDPSRDRTLDWPTGFGYDDDEPGGREGGASAPGSSRP